MNEQQLPPLPDALEVWLGVYWDAGYNEAERANLALSEIRKAVRDYARAKLAANVPADPCLVLWKAMNAAGKVGNRTDDKLIVKFLREAGYCIAATPAPAPEADALEKAHEARRQAQAAKGRP